MKKFTLEIFLSLLLVQFAAIGLQAQCSLTCNNGIQVSVAPTDAGNPGICEAGVNIDGITEGANDTIIFGTTGSCMAAEALIEVRSGSLLVTSGLVTTVDEQVLFDGSPYLGSTLTTKVTLLGANGNTINSCWGSIVVEDKAGPVFDCPTAPYVVDCDDDLSGAPEPTISDNCDPEPTFFLVNEVQSGAACGNQLTIVREYSGSDANGNPVISNCNVTIVINPISIMFPEDITWDCDQFARFNNITDPTPLSNGIDPDDACEETSSTRLMGTGSGAPNVLGVNNDICRFNVTHSDQVLAACQGADLSVVFKIARTWTVLNWCTGQITNSTQIIAVVDKTAPEITVNVANLIANIAGGNSAHPVCSSTDLIPAPIVTDDCSGITSIQVFTSAGEANPVTNAAGDVVGYAIPSPGLSLGNHDITFRATDFCGNFSEEVETFTVIDGNVPIPVCREVTQIALTSGINGISRVSAEYFDEGSYDDCAPVFFKVRRMDTSCEGFEDDEDLFNDEIRFCCEDIGSTTMVVLRVYDARPDNGSVDLDHLLERSNECMIEVLVEDKAAPRCLAPNDLFLTCAEVADNIDYNDFDLLDNLFGAPSATDNCGADAVTTSVNNNLDQCGVGTVVRNFRATDINGNSSGNACRQVITVQPVTDYCLILPRDFNGECNNAVNPDELTFEENGCDLIGITRELDEFFAGGPSGECKKEIFDWHVINWCEYDGISAAAVLPRADFTQREREVTGVTICSNGTNFGRVDSNGDILDEFPTGGFYTYRQLVTIFDVTPPEVSYDGDVEFCGGDLDEDPCTGQVDIEISVMEECTDVLTTTWAITTFSDSFSNSDITGAGTTISRRLPLGTHAVRFFVADDCGNISHLDVTFTVIDCKAPTPVCFNGLSIDLKATGMVGLWAVDFDASSFDFCHDFEITANVVTDRIPDGVINSADYLTTRPTTDQIFFDCGQVGVTTFVQVWVHELSDDGVNDDDFCVATILVQDNMDACNASRVRIAGAIEDEKGQSVQDVNVAINGGMSASNLTTNNGSYSFDVVEGEDYTITPAKNDDIRNGVSTFDLAMISKHVLNVQTLDSPYKVIAADANNSGSITTLDLVAIRKVILFVANEFPNNSSWRFIDSDYVFADPQNPFNITLPEVINYNNVVGLSTGNFTGIKIGDVSGDAQANNLGGVIDRSLNGSFGLNTIDKAFKSGEELVVPVTADMAAIEGFQATLNFDAKALELVEIESKVLTEENFGTALTADGIITMSWNGQTNATEAFTLVFKAKTEGTLADILSINSAYTVAEAFTGNDLMDVELTFGNANSASEFALHQNIPNPFTTETTISFELQQADAATLTISDVSGKILKVVRGNYNAGHNSVVIDMANNFSKGMLIYELKTSTDKATRKMTIVK